MEFTQYLKFIQRWLWLMLMLSLGFAMIAALADLGKTQLYASKITILVRQAGTVERGTPNYQDLVTSERRAVTYSLLLTKRSVMAGVIANLNLSMDPGTLASHIETEFLKNTELIEVTVKDTDPDRAALIANEIVKVFNTEEADLLANPYAAALPSLHAVEPARRGSPVPPDTLRNMILAAVVGVMLSIGAGIIAEHFDDRIRNDEQLQQALGIPPIATIGRLGGFTPASRLVTMTKATSAVAETYRMFRAYIDMAADEHPIRSLVVVSPHHGEGKSTTAANLAAAVAQTSCRVVLIDANLRQPTLHSIFKVENGPGLADLLVQPQEGADQARMVGASNAKNLPTQPEGSSVTNYLVQTSVPNLRLMTCGTHSPNPTNLLGSPRLTSVINALKDHADLVVIDTPELLGVVDASLLVKIADTALLIARSGSTRASALRQAYLHLERAQTPILGVVLNCASSSFLSMRTPGGPGGGQRQHRSLPYFGAKLAQLVNLPGAATNLADGTEQQQQQVVE